MSEHAEGAARFACPHDHCYLSDRHRENERRTWAVIALTFVTMIAEIISGAIFGSMALLADGWHMASHASALGIAALAYHLARRHKDNPRFTFGTGKIGDLAGYSSALLLMLIAFIMAYESIRRLMSPVPIRFNEAIAVAVIGLIVNLVSALLLNEGGGHSHGHGHDHGHSHAHDDVDDDAHPRDHAPHLHDPHLSDPHQDQDHNLRAAYLHVLADALTSILAIFALVMGKIWGWAALDPLMGVVGAVVITRWSYVLMRQSGGVLLDIAPHPGLIRRIRETVAAAGDARIDDLHVWRLGPGHYGLIVAVSTTDGRGPADFKERLCRVPGLAHVTVEVHAAQLPDALG